MRISIVTPSFNSAPYFEKTIQSVIAQDCRALEYIVVDGGSSDDSQSVISKYSSQIDWSCSEKDDGQYDAINKGFEHSSGEIMGWLNSSDLYLPWTLQVVEEIFTKYPEVEWISSLQKTVLTSKGSHASQNIHGFSADKFAQGLLGSATNANFIQQETCFWRRSLWDKIGGQILSQYRYAGDFWLWSQFFQHAKCTGVDAPLAVFRFHDDQRSGNERYLEEVTEILRDIQSSSKRNLYQPGSQNILPRWQFSQSQGGHPEWVIVKYFDDWYLDIVKFWDDFFDSIKWKLANLSYLPISLLKFIKRGCKRV